MKKTVLLATSAVIAATSAVAVDVEMYGQVNKSFIVVDDGENTNTSVVDNDMSSTRIGVMGSQALDNGLTASVLMEFEAQSNPSNTATQGVSIVGDNTAGDVTERHSRVGLAGDFGALWIGHTSSATDSAAEQDLVGVQDVMGSNVAYFGGGLAWQNVEAGDVGADVADTIYAIDGGRANAVRYDTPIWNGVQGRVSVANGGEVQAGVYYDGKYDAFAVKAAVGYEDGNAQAASSDLEERYMASVSVKHDSGLAATVAYGHQSNDAAGGEDPETYYVKAGYAWDAFEVAAEYAKSTTAGDDEGQVMGVGAQYNMGNGVSAAAFYKQFSRQDGDAGEADGDDINVLGVNMRVKF